MIAYVASDLLHGPDKTGAYVAEASELGLRPGLWPKQIRTRTKTFTKLTQKFNAEHELQAVVYLGETGGRLTVFND